MRTERRSSFLSTTKVGDTEPSIENNTSEYLLNVLGDVTGDVIMQGLTGSR